MTEERTGVLAGKVVLVTGGGRGIGSAYARLAAAEGATVVVNDIDEQPARHVVDQITEAGGRALAHVGDVSEWTAAESAVGAAIAGFGALDGLVNNAGLFTMDRPDRQDEASFRRIVEVNVLGVAFCGMHAIRHMSARGQGSIVNVTSGAHAGMEGMAAYGASKGAVASLTYGWAVDLQGTGVRVNAISPLGGTRMINEIDRFYQVPDGERGRARRDSPAPEANAPAVIYLLSDLAAGVHGQVVRVDGDVLSLVSHPRNILPTVPGAAASIDSVEEAFAGPLRDWLQPLGLHGAHLQPG